MEHPRHEEYTRLVTIVGKVIVEPIESDADPEVVAWLTARQANPAILETRQPAAVAGRFSVFAADPVEVFTVEPGESVPLARLGEKFRSFGAVSSNGQSSYAGGWFGYISYEAGLPARLVQPRQYVADIPLARFGLYDHVLIFDHNEKKWQAAAIDWHQRIPYQRSAVRRLKTLRERLEKARSLTLRLPSTSQRRQALQAMSRGQYSATVRRILRYIEAGDIYQANLAQRFRIDHEGSPFELYRRVRRNNPAAFAAFLSWDDRAIVSASPELFVELRDGHVITRPIKGTRPRSASEPIDTLRREELESSEKEQAELTMIIDLLRNDLGRVCEYGSVIVKDKGAIEAHPTVFHRVATIEGRLTNANNWSDLLQAAFPGGSIVGAPKIRAMQIIRELEPFVRGAYCGAIGWIGLDGNMVLNVAIRTMLSHDGLVDIFAGGGIVAESDPDSEYAEILAKAAGLLSAVGAELEEARLCKSARATVP